MDIDQTIHKCQSCGGELRFETGDADRYVCAYCRRAYPANVAEKYTRTLEELLTEAKREMVHNLRRQLYAAVTADHISSTEVIRLCNELLDCLPDDFAAGFYKVAAGTDLRALNAAIQSIDVNEHYDDVAGIVTFLVKSLSTDKDYLLALNDLVERAYQKRDGQLFHKYATLISTEACRVRDGVYETSLKRDVFVAYSSKDMTQVMELVAELERQGLSCFVSTRNLRHGAGSVENYAAALEEAMDNCHTIVFVSTPHSRNFDCDAFRVELKYIQQQDIAGAPAEYRRNYATMPHKYKKPRVEYRPGSQEESSSAADRKVAEFFEGYEWVYTPRDVADRVADQLYNDPIPVPPPAPTPEPAPAPAPKPEKVKQPKPPKVKTPKPPRDNTRLGQNLLTVGGWVLPPLPFIALLIWALIQGESLTKWLWIVGIGVVVSCVRVMTATIADGVVRLFFSIATFITTAMTAFMNEPIVLLTISLSSLVLCGMSLLFKKYKICTDYDMHFSCMCFEGVWFSVGILVAVGLFMFPSWGLWAMVFIGAAIGCGNIVYSLLGFGMDDMNSLGGIISLIVFTLMGAVLLFINRETAYVTLSLMLLNAGAWIITAIVYDKEHTIECGYRSSYTDYGTGWGIHVTTGAVMLVVLTILTPIWYGEWKTQPVSISGGSVSFNLDRQTGVFFAEHLEDVYILSNIDRPNIDTVIIGEGYEELSDYALSDCDNLTTVYLPASLLDIKEKVTIYCDNLRYIYIGYNPDGTPSDTPASLKSLGYNAFDDCPIKTIYYNGTTAQWEAIEKGTNKKGKPWDSNLDRYEVVCTDGTLQFGRD